MDELFESLRESVSLYLTDDGPAPEPHVAPATLTDRLLLEASFAAWLDYICALLVRCVGLRVSATRKRGQRMFSRVDGIEAKLDRAEAQMDAFDKAWQAWVTKNQPWGADREVEKGKRRYIFILRELEPIPLEFRVIAGEIVHDMRSALDHLACHLVERSGGKVTNSTAWPIKKSRAAWKRQVERRHRPFQLWRKAGSGPLKGLPLDSDAWALIERSQPYSRSDNAEGDPLWTLERMWNTDKHRLLNAMAVFAEPQAVLDVFCATPKITPIEAKPLIQASRPLKDGTKLALYRFPTDQPIPEMRVCGNFAMQVAIGDADGEDRSAWRDTLKIIRAIVAEGKAI